MAIRRRDHFGGYATDAPRAPESYLRVRAAETAARAPDRMVRTLEYELTGVARFLDRVYLHEHLKRKTALALTKLQGLVRREAPDGSLRHAANDEAARRRPTVLRGLARIALSVAATVLLVPLLSFASIARALYLRIVRGKASDILRVRQGRYRDGIFYGAQMVFNKPFDSSRLREVFFEMIEEAGIDRNKARLEFEPETPRLFPASGVAEADHYVEKGTNWVKRGTDFKGTVLWLRVFSGKAGAPTVLQAGLPGGSWDGSSCFNFMKELVARCHGRPRGDVFQGKRLTLRPASARVLDQSSFVAFLLRLPRRSLQYVEPRLEPRRRVPRVGRGRRKPREPGRQALRGFGLCRGRCVSRSLG